jgi:hypothetical protein
MSGAYEFDGDLGREGEDIGAGDDTGARFLQRALDVVDHLEAARRVDVGGHVFLGLDRREVLVEEQRAVAALKRIGTQACQSDDATLKYADRISWGLLPALTLTKQSWKWRRMRLAGMRGSEARASRMTRRTTS